MKKIAIILALMLVLAVVITSGCTNTQNTTSGNGSGQNQTSTPGYSVVPIIIVESGNIAPESKLGNVAKYSKN